MNDAKPSKTRSRVNLTDTRVRNAKALGVLYRVWDSQVPGFNLQITAAGAKSFRVQFQRPDGQKVSATIGSAAVWTVEDAREKARELRQLHDDGRDARAFLKEARSAKDVATLVEIWREDYAPQRKPSTRASYESIIRNIILPAFGKRLVKDLAFEDVKALHKKVGRKTPVQANRLRAVLSKLLTIAEREGLRPDGSNPCHRLEPFREKPRKKAFSASDLAALEAGLRKLVSGKKLDDAVADLIRVLALSGLRRGEVLGLAWKDIDLDRNAMTFEFHKTDDDGAKVLPLNSHLRSLLKKRSASRLSAFVFPGRSVDRPFNGFGKVWLRVVEASGLEGLRPHDLRHTFQTVCTELGYPPAISDALVGHSMGKIRDTYINLGTDGILARASQETADWIQAALSGAEPKPGVKASGKRKPRSVTA